MKKDKKKRDLGLFNDINYLRQLNTVELNWLSVFLHDTSLVKQVFNERSG